MFEGIMFISYLGTFYTIFENIFMPSFKTMFTQCWTKEQNFFSGAYYLMDFSNQTVLKCFGPKLISDKIFVVEKCNMEKLVKLNSSVPT